MATDPIADALRTLPLTNAQRASAWDALYSPDDAIAQRGLEALPLPKERKAALWDLRPSDVAPAQPPAQPKASQPTTAPPPNPQQMDPRLAATLQARTIADVPGEQERTTGGMQALAGVGKSVLGTVQGLNKLAQQVPVVGRFVPTVPVDKIANPAPENADQRLGKTAMDVAQFFVPAGATGKLKAALATGHGVLDALIGASLEGASSAGVQAAQTGTLQDTGKTGLAAAGTTLGIGGLAHGLQWTGQRVEDALIKASQQDVKNGFRVGNIFKYNLGGSLETSFDKSTQAIESLGRQLQQTVSKASDGGPRLDLLGILADTSKQVIADSAKTFGSNADIGRAVDKLLNDPLFQHIAQDGTVDLASAQKVKQALGDLGAWLHDPTGRVMRDPESKGLEYVANAMYSRLNTAIADMSGGSYREINKQLSEIIPIRQAIIRRIPIEMRSNFMNLGDLLSFSSGTWGLSLANRLLKSGTAANVMVRGGDAMGRVVAPAIGPAAGAAFSEMKK